MTQSRWLSVFGALPFTLALPFADLYGAAALTVVIGLIMSASMSQVLVYALELTPGKVGTVSGLFFGFSFGMGGLGAAVRAPRSASSSARWSRSRSASSITPKGYASRSRPGWSDHRTARGPTAAPHRSWAASVQPLARSA